jgi:hypothetical protein
MSRVTESPSELGLLARIRAELRSDDASSLFAALVQAQERGGAKAIKELVTKALAEERTIRPVDAEESQDA